MAKVSKEDVKKEFIFKNGYGYWKLTLLNKSYTCDVDELNETIEELVSDLKEEAEK